MRDLLEQIVVRTKTVDGNVSDLPPHTSASIFDAEYRYVQVGTDDRGEPVCAPNPAQAITFSSEIAVELSSRCDRDLEVVLAVRCQELTSLRTCAAGPVVLPAGGTVTISIRGTMTDAQMTLSAFVHPRRSASAQQTGVAEPAQELASEAGGELPST